MNVFQIKLKIYILKDIQLEDLQTVISTFIDGGLAKDDELLKIHVSNSFKSYCFDYLYPLESDKIYKKGKIYTVTIRTIDHYLADYFSNVLVNERNEAVKGLTSEITIIPKKFIEKIYSITPVIIKNENGYWKNIIKFDEYERRLKENIIKKYNYVMNTKIEEDFQLYTNIEIKNQKPITTNYKNIKLLGDKLSINIADNKMAQELAYLSLGMGLLEMNARGYGYMNYRWL